MTKEINILLTHTIFITIYITIYINLQFSNKYHSIIISLYLYHYICIIISLTLSYLLLIIYCNSTHHSSMIITYLHDLNYIMTNSIAHSLHHVMNILLYLNNNYVTKGSNTHLYHLYAVLFSIYGCLAPEPKSHVDQSPLLGKCYNLHPLICHHNQSHHLCHPPHSPHSPFGPSSQVQPPGGCLDPKEHDLPPY